MMQILNANKKLILLIGVPIIVYFILGRIILNAIHPPDDNWPEEAVSYRIENINGPLKLLWSRSGLFVRHFWSSYPSAMAASQGKVFVEGMLGQTEGYAEMLAFQGQDGSLAWRSNEFIPDARLVATSETLYAGENGYATIISYDLKTGKVLWSRRMPGGRSIQQLNVIDNIVYVVSSAGIHFLKADTGEILKTFTNSPSTKTIQDAMAQLVSPQPVQIKSEYFEGAAFIPYDLRFKDGWAIDAKTGEQLWNVAGGTLSNIVISTSAVYVLNFDRELLILNPESGAVLASVRFEPDKKTVNTNNGFAQSFYVAVDEPTGMIYVFLGDGTQLFAFKIVGNLQQ
jgi:outer membrane protein assembly factor BamB